MKCEVGKSNWYPPQIRWKVLTWWLAVGTSQWGWEGWNPFCLAPTWLVFSSFMISSFIFILGILIVTICTRASLVSTIIPANINQFDQPGLVGWLPVSVSLLHLGDSSLTRLHMIVENCGLDHDVHYGQWCNDVCQLDIVKVLTWWTWPATSFSHREMTRPEFPGTSDRRSPNIKRRSPS